MPACTRSAIAMLTDFFAADDIEATARRTGFVQRTSKITGKLFLALVTFGTWSEGKTTLAQLAAKGTQLRQPVEVSPEAIHQRMNKKAIAFLQDMLRQVLGKLQSLTPVGDDGLFAAFTKVYLADSTGFALPDALQKTFPGAGGSAAKAGAKIQAVWDYKSSLFAHFALTPWNIPDQRYVDTVVALAQKGILFLFDLGYFKIQALGRLATAGAYFCCRLNHQTNMYETVAGRVESVRWRRSSGPSRLTACSLRKPSSLGRKRRSPRVSLPCVCPRRSSIPAGEAPGRTPGKKATHRPKPISACWPGTSLLPMSLLRYGPRQRSQKSIQYAGK